MNAIGSYRYVVRCGVHRAVFAMNSRTEQKRGDQVIARSNRGLELGEVLCEITPENQSATEKLPGGSIQRPAGPVELETSGKLKTQSALDAKQCQEAVESLDLSMHIIDVERIFGGEMITIYFTAAERVDFRELVKKLASKFHARIEMRQVGARDEAKLLGDYGDCGRPLCCSGFLLEMPPVTMRMAKLQKATLDPNKLSGRCGRLKCCLRYENDHYEELASKIPPPGSEILTREGRARVLNVELLAQQMLIATEDNRRILITPEECLSVIKRGAELS
ncbi:MAG: stage 0 sporulation family protein [Planctomycetota bacterium]|jgi:cell fate regulator YaaT (PSP1 superfamily)